MKTNLTNLLKKGAFIGLGFLASTSAFAQPGYVDFRNFNPPNYVYDAMTGQKASGPNYKVEVLWSPDSFNFYPIANGTTTFLTGDGAGLFNGGVIPVGPPPGTLVYMKVRAWFPSTYPAYELALSSGDPSVVAGESSVAPKVLGGAMFPTPPNLSELGGFYLQSPFTSSGSLSVTIAPASAVTAGARWRVDGGAWQNSGATVSGLSVGSHTVSFSTITGWLTPANQSVAIYANQTTMTAGGYQSLPGALQVTVNPPSLGAQWRVDGGAWQNSGNIVSGLSAGLHTVSFVPFQGWTTPPSQSVTIPPGQTNSLTFTYYPTNALQVNISPANAISAGAQWRVDGGIWRNSGTTIYALSVGSHTMSFSTVSGWITPTNQAVMLDTNQTSVVTGIYVAQLPATVTLGNLLQYFDGTAKTVSPTTEPANLPVSVTYNASTAAPTNVGNYTVVATVTDPEYQGAATNTLAIVIPDIATNVIAAESATLSPGQSATVSTAPSLTGEAGVSATATNDAGATLLVAVANYDGPPTNVPVFLAGASYMDIRVWGADAGDSLSADFYYPSTLTGAAESSLDLDYWNGAGWISVRSSSGSLPVKDTTDNLDGTVSGGRFTVVFNSTSTPSLTGLTGTVFALAPVVVAPTPPQLTVLPVQPDGAFRFEFTNTPGAAFNALYTTNLSVPFSNWTVLGAIMENPPGHFQFTDSQVTNSPQRFYRVHAP